ncbi:serine/threonine-protein kinase [Methylotenera mobilis]|uniref:Serine/threonine protein kinase n=1 Tax=Methylotenera mobilis (strain JLW8 / ATCC BAA-1282 / DSM 17540) TaxID=583345 RepID=C6WUH4_METML|nr:serine/threonine-protein kinase [Methylotenera mobilis]ACT47573.1 serine/threonine protein kinase [Methylotenera mobilis JLW8]
MVYTIIQELGSGSFGKVNLAIDEHGYQVAIKTLEPSPVLQQAVANGNVSMEDLVKRFSREVKYQSKIANPNVVRIVGHDISAIPPYFVMELADCTLQQELKKDRTLGSKPQQALFDILTGLEAIHEAGIFHRDLKPANVLKFTSADGGVRYSLSDFGLMTASLGETTTLTPSGAGGGTVNYAAPELINNLKRATAASDIYSFGVILFDIFGGGANRVPYTEVQLGGPIGKIASRCTKNLAARRYSSIADLRADLFDALSSEDVKFLSSAEQTVIELLENNDLLIEQQWDQVFVFIEDNQQNLAKCHQVFKAFRNNHLEQLKNEAPDLLGAFGSDFCNYIIEGEGGFNFEYCDVLSDKLMKLYELGDVALKSLVILSLLNLGASHNRWVVERRFMNLAGQELPENVANKIVMDVEILEFEFIRFMSHVERSINANSNSLHPILQKIIVR